MLEFNYRAAKQHSPLICHL